MTGKKLIKKFYGSMTDKAGNFLAPHYPFDTILHITVDCNSQYDGIIERLPYLGGLRNFYTPIIIINGWFVCVYNAMHTQGIEDDVIGYVISEVTDGLFDNVPGFLAKRIKGLVFSGFFKRYIQRQAKKSQKRKFNGDWVYTAEVTKWGKKSEVREVSLVFSECGVHKYYEDEKAEALKKYCNFCDPQYSIRYGLGLDASQTMAQGCRECRLTFNSMRDTEIPENIISMRESAKRTLESKNAVV